MEGTMYMPEKGKHRSPDRHSPGTSPNRNLGPVMQGNFVKHGYH